MTKGKEEAFRGGDSSVCYLDFGNCLTGLYTYIKICHILPFIYV